MNSGNANQYSIETNNLIENYTNLRERQVNDNLSALNNLEKLIKQREKYIHDLSQDYEDSQKLCGDDIFLKEYTELYDVNMWIHKVKLTKLKNNLQELRMNILKQNEKYKSQDECFNKIIRNRIAFEKKYNTDN